MSKENKEGYAIAEVVGILERSILEIKKPYTINELIGNCYHNLEDYFKRKTNEDEVIVKVDTYNELIEQATKFTNEQRRADELVDRNEKLEAKAAEDAREIARLLDRNVEIERLLEMASDGNLNMKEYLEKKDEQVDKLLSILDAVVAGKV